MILAAMVFAQLTLSCDQVRALHRVLGHDEFFRQAIALGFTDEQMRAALACIGARR